MTPKAVFLDVDGTLIDSNDFRVDAWAEAFHDAGLLAERDQIRSQIGKGGDGLIPSLFPELDAETRGRIDRNHSAIFARRYRSKVKPFAMAGDFVRRLHSDGKQVIIATSSKEADTTYYTDLLNITDVIDGITTGEEVESSKPTGDIFHSALAKIFPLGANDAIAIGDSPYDVLGARKNHVPTIALLSGGFSELVLEEAGAIAIYHSVQDLYEHYDASPLAGE